MEDSSFFVGSNSESAATLGNTKFWMGHPRLTAVLGP